MTFVPVFAEITLQARIFGLVFALAFLVVLMELVRRHKLQERYTIVWFVAGAALVLLAAVPGVLTVLADAFGVTDTNAALFAAVLLALGGLILNLTVVVSRQAEQISRLGQELAILNSRTPDEPDPTTLAQADELALAELDDHEFDEDD